jgi:hypothetical protein
MGERIARHGTWVYVRGELFSDFPSQVAGFTPFTKGWIFYRLAVLLRMVSVRELTYFVRALFSVVLWCLWLVVVGPPL